MEDSLKYCTSCGRQVKTKCTCIANITLSLFDKVILASLVLLLPPIMFSLATFFLTLDFIHANYQWIGNLVLILVVFILVILDYLFNKNYLVIFFSCHQKVTRSFKFGDIYSKLCARCSGIFVGLFFSFLTIYLNVHFLLLFLIATPLIVDGTLQKLTLYTSNNAKRFITGILFGPLVVFLFSFYNYTLLEFSIFLSELL